jgi:hypothetical protein
MVFFMLPDSNLFHFNLFSDLTNILTINQNLSLKAVL